MVGEKSYLPAQGNHSAPYGNSASPFKVRLSTLTTILLALVLFGYPIAGALHSIVGGASQTLSYPMRAITLLLAGVVIFVGFRASQFKRLDRLLVLFLAIYTMRLLYDWSVAEIPAADNAIVFLFALIVVPLLACAMKSPLITEEGLQVALLVFGGIFVFLILFARSAGLAYNPWEDSGYQLTRLGFEALNSITIGRAAGVLSIVGAFVAASRNTSKGWRMLGFAAVAAGLFSILLANSRGPLVALLVTYCFVFIFRPKLLLLSLAVGGAYFAVFGMENVLIENAIERFAVAGSAQDGASETRFLIMGLAWTKFLENPVLGYHYIDPNLGEGFYPHNLVIESAMALGVLGLMIFVTLVIRTLRIAVFNRRRVPMLAALFVYYFMAANFSGSLWGSQEFFVTMAMCLALAKQRPQS